MCTVHINNNKNFVYPIHIHTVICNIYTYIYNMIFYSMYEYFIRAHKYYALVFFTFLVLVFFTLSYQKTVLKTHTDIKTHTDNHISPLIHFIFYSSTFL